MAQDHVLASILANNAQWAEDVEKSTPQFFARSEVLDDKKNKILWIGCADYRVPESVLTPCPPVDIYVHRNIANRVPLDDENAQSVLAHTLSVGISHVLVVGHTDCAGVKLSHDIANGKVDPPNPPLGRWVNPIVALAKQSPGISVDELMRKNVHVQVNNVAATIAAHAQEPDVKVVGLVYDVKDGILHPLL